MDFVTDATIYIRVSFLYIHNHSSAYKKNKREDKKTTKKKEK
jgi:hypothetical protein